MRLGVDRGEGGLQSAGGVGREVIHLMVDEREPDGVPEQRPEGLDGLVVAIPDLFHQPEPLLDRVQYDTGEPVGRGVEPEEVAVSQQVIAQGDAERDGPRVPRALDRFGELDCGQPASGDRVEELVLVVEPEVHGHRVDVERRGELSHREPLESVLGDEGEGDVDDVVGSKTGGFGGERLAVGHDGEYTLYIRDASRRAVWVWRRHLGRSPDRARTSARLSAVTDTTETANAWLSDEELETARGRVPMVYVDAVPVRVDALGEVTQVGLLLQAMPDGTVSRALVTGRILFGERIRSALMRHLEKDLGPMALPRIPANPTPFTVAEYFPDPSVSGYHDPRQHAVSLAYVVPIDGEPEPSENSLDLTWLTPREAASAEVREEMTGGHDRLLRLALAHVCQLP